MSARTPVKKSLLTLAGLASILSVPLVSSAQSRDRDHDDEHDHEHDEHDDDEYDDEHDDDGDDDDEWSEHCTKPKPNRERVKDHRKHCAGQGGASTTVLPPCARR